MGDDGKANKMRYTGSGYSAEVDANPVRVNIPPGNQPNLC